MKNNILIDSNHTARITDFGLMSLLRHPLISISVTLPTWEGTYRWMAPELLLDWKPHPSKEPDIYAPGMVIYEVCSTAFLSKSALIGRSHRSSQTNNRSRVFLPTPHPHGSSLENDLRGQ